MLQWLGCDLAQGWFYGKALPAKDLPYAVSNFPQNKSSAMSIGAVGRVSRGSFCARAGFATRLAWLNGTTTRLRQDGHARPPLPACQAASSRRRLARAICSGRDQRPEERRVGKG